MIHNNCSAHSAPPPPLRGRAGEGGSPGLRRLRLPPSRRCCAAPTSPSRGEVEGNGAMIGKLKGLIDSYGEDYVILDVAGVGYQVHCASRTYVSIDSTAASPGEGSACNVRAEQCT